MSTTRYAQYDTTTGAILRVITRSDTAWHVDYPHPPGTSLRYIDETVLDYYSHYFVIGAGDPVLTARPVIGMGSDATLTGDGSSQTVATGLPAGTAVYRDDEYLGTFSGTLTWSPVSPGDDGRHRYDIEPPFPDARETIFITVVP